MRGAAPRRLRRGPALAGLVLASAVAMVLPVSCGGETSPRAPSPAPSAPAPSLGAPPSSPAARPPASATTEIPCIALPLPAGLTPGSVPHYDPGDDYAEQVAAAVERYQELDIHSGVGLTSYDPLGDFLNFGQNDRYEADASLRWDDDGAPLVEYDGTYYHNPVTVAQYALTLYGRFLRGSEDRDAFLSIVRVLLTMQDARGAFPAPYPFTYYRTGETLEPGWVSGMAQGQALSVLRRAYAITGDPRYLAAGDAALAYLATGRTAGGPMDTFTSLAPELSGLITFEEFATSEPHYTLNGFLFALLGVYDWSTIDRGSGDSPSATAARLFECGLATTVYTLPYYDVGGFSAYDLGHVLTGGKPNVQAEYHAIHLDLLRTLDAIRPHPDIERWLEKWDAAVAPP